MKTDHSSEKPPTPGRSLRSTSASSSPGTSYRLTFRLIGIPVLAVAGVLIYRGVHDRFVLPECDSGRAKDTLAEVFKQLKIEPLRYEPIKTISSGKNEVVCNALLPLADGATVNVDYSFFWQGDKANMRYSISRREARSSEIIKRENPV
ncbi:MAG TPA: hypothetical protein VEJ37_11415 [Xanthobacteraceae bacterium]|nr:hypothetical protein [Xanthobacteraceae bacterium]